MSTAFVKWTKSEENVPHWLGDFSPRGTFDSENNILTDSNGTQVSLPKALSTVSETLSSPLDARQWSASSYHLHVDPHLQSNQYSSYPQSDSFPVRTNPHVEKLLSPSALEFSSCSTEIHSISLTPSLEPSSCASAINHVSQSSKIMPVDKCSTTNVKNSPQRQKFASSLAASAVGAITARAIHGSLSGSPEEDSKFSLLSSEETFKSSSSGHSNDLPHKKHPLNNESSDIYLGNLHPPYVPEKPHPFFSVLNSYPQSTIDHMEVQPAWATSAFSNQRIEELESPFSSGGFRGHFLRNQDSANLHRGSRAPPPPALHPHPGWSHSYPVVTTTSISNTSPVSSDYCIYTPNNLMPTITGNENASMSTSARPSNFIPYVSASSSFASYTEAAQSSINSFEDFVTSLPSTSYTPATLSDKPPSFSNNSEHSLQSVQTPSTDFFNLSLHGNLTRQYSHLRTSDYNLSPPASSDSTAFGCKWYPTSSLHNPNTRHLSDTYTYNLSNQPLSSSSTQSSFDYLSSPKKSHLTPTTFEFPFNGVSPRNQLHTQNSYDDDYPLDQPKTTFQSDENIALVRMTKKGKPRLPRQLISCDFCRMRKLRCDGQHPCGHCARRNKECHFQESVRKRGKGRKKKKEGEAISGSEITTENQELKTASNSSILKVEQEVLTRSKFRPEDSASFSQVSSMKTENYINMGISHSPNLFFQSSQRDREAFWNELGGAFDETNQISQPGGDFAQGDRIINEISHVEVNPNYEN